MASGLQDIISLESGHENKTRQVLIYFIPGNPGLVEYYRRFLQKLHDILSQSLPKERIHVYGASHDGFEFLEETKQRHNRQNHPPPYSLSEEVEGVISKVSKRARYVAKLNPEVKTEVILIGHSVGSYMLLETVTAYQKNFPDREIYNIIGGVCLFPTIIDMFRSEKGRVFRWILPIPGLGLFLTGIIRLLQWFAPKMLSALARKHTPGTEGADVTEALMRSECGARQVLHMARNELDEIRHDKWHPANLWGVLDHEGDGEGEETSLMDGTDFSRFANGSDSFGGEKSRTKLLFLWGDKDYWVHDETRDGVIAKRHTRDTHETRHWPWMEIVENKEIPHTFSLVPEHSDQVAGKTAEWVEWLLSSREN